MAKDQVSQIKTNLIEFSNIVLLLKHLYEWVLQVVIADLPNYYKKHGGMVISTSIDKFIYVIVRKQVGFLIINLN